MGSAFGWVLDWAWGRNLRTSNVDVGTNEAPRGPLTRCREIPMRVLVLSLMRTGDVPTGEALKILGYKPFGMAEGTRAPAHFYGLWYQAVRAKYRGIGTPWAKKEFDAALGQYDTVLSLPGCLYAEELVAAYPEAKVILMTRSTQSWVDTMRACGGEMLSWRGWWVMQRWDRSMMGPLISLIQEQMRVMCNDDFTPYGWAARRFEEHYELVRRIVPEGNLLVYDAAQGWEPLCHFLEKPVPESSPFPSLDKDNDDRNIIKMQRVLWYVGMGRSLFNIAVRFVGLPLLLAYGWQKHNLIKSLIGPLLQYTKA